jgi:hypothetical protein
MSLDSGMVHRFFAPNGSRPSCGRARTTLAPAGRRWHILPHTQRRGLEKNDRGCSGDATRAIVAHVLREIVLGADLVSGALSTPSSYDCLSRLDAFVAVARKLLVILNAIARERTAWQA